MIYLDNAATTLQKPGCVSEAVVRAMCTLGNAGRSAHEGSLDASRTVYRAREALARLFAASGPEQIAFTSNATQALNTAILGTLEPGDHVITTALEHNSVLRPLYALEEQGVKLTVLPADRRGRIRYEDFEAQIRPDTKAIVCTHGSNLTGRVLDIRRIGAIARDHGLLFIVDASQTAGLIPINVEAMNIDILCFTGHKSLLGPQGTGGLYVRRGVQLRPLLRGGTGVQTYLREQPPQMPTLLEAGTLNVHGLAGLAAAVEYILEQGTDSIREKELRLTRLFYEGVKSIPGICVYSDPWEALCCPIVSLNIGDADSGSLSDALWQGWGIATRPGAHCAPLLHEALGTREKGAVRFSFSHFNTEEEIQTAVSALRTLAEGDI